MGASHHVCHPAMTTLAARGKTALHIDTSELLHFHRPLLDERTVLVAVSQSGRSAELVRLAADVRSARQRPLLVAVTNGLDNPLAGAADLALDTAVGEETGPSSMTLVASLAALSIVAGILVGETAADAVRRAEAEVDVAAAASERLLAAPGAMAEDLADDFEGRPVIILLGRGPGRAAADAGALILEEVAAQ